MNTPSMQPKSSTRLPFGRIAAEQHPLPPLEVGEPPVEIERARAVLFQPLAILAVVLVGRGGLRERVDHQDTASARPRPANSCPIRARSPATRSQL